MNWDSIQQVIRIMLFAVGGYALGDGVADSEIFKQAVGGVIAAGAFVWWLVWEKGHEHRDVS